jgi:hypothetical protein
MSLTPPPAAADESRREREATATGVDDPAASLDDADVLATVPLAQTLNEIGAALCLLIIALFLASVFMVGRTWMAL